MFNTTEYTNITEQILKYKFRIFSTDHFMWVAHGTYGAIQKTKLIV